MQHPARPDDPTGLAGARVAILMRTRDRPILLARALASVLAQRHRDWHLLLVNDGGDPAPVDALLSRHDTGFGTRVSVSHASRSAGPDAALAAAFAMCGAAEPFDHVAVHDDDDSWHPDFLRRATAWLDAPAHRAFVAVISRWTLVREQLDRAGVMERSREPVPFDEPVLRYEALLEQPRFPSICLLQRRSALENAGGFAAKGGAWERALRLAATGDIGVLPEPLAFQHRREAGALPEYANAADEASYSSGAHGILFRNAGLRALGREQPGALSMLGVLGAQADRQHERAEQRRDLVLANLDRNGLWGHARHEDLQGRLVRVEETLARIEASLALLHAPRPVPRWRRLLRRMAARLAPGLIARLARRVAGGPTNGLAG